MGQLRTGLKDGIISVLDEGESGAQVYEATLTQTSTAAPVATVLFNSIPVTLTWGYTSPGVYTVTAGAAAFTANKTQIVMGSGNSFPTLIRYVRTSTTVITLTVSIEDYTPANDLLTETAIRIVVFP